MIMQTPLSRAVMTATVMMALWAVTTPVSGDEQADGRPPIISPIDDQTPLFHEAAGSGAGMPRGGTSPGIQAAADHVIGMQCTNGGWNWPHGGCAATYTNIDAPIGLGLLRAFEVLGDSTILNAAMDAADHNMTSEYDNGNARFSSYQAFFFHSLTQQSSDSTYSDFAATEFFDALDNGTYGPDSDWTTADWIQVVKDARSGVWINLRPWEFSTNAWTAGQIGNSGQQTAFEDAIIDGLETLDNSDPSSAYSDIIGIAGAVRGLAMSDRCTWTALSSPNHSLITGIDDLCDLANTLAGLQNPDGSWYWHSNLASPGESDKDTQTTAYAVLALLAAEDSACGCGSYATEINMGRQWLDSMQDVDGGFFSYPGGDHNIEVESEALNALVEENVSLASTACEPGGTVTVTIEMDEMESMIVGGQFFLEYDSSVLDFVSADPGGSPFDQQVFESVDEGAGTIDYAVGVTGGGPGTFGPATLATLTFDVLAETCDTADLVTFRSHTPPTRLTDMFGNAVLPTLLDLPAITIDQTPPTFASVPSAISVNADAGVCSAIVDPGMATAVDNCDSSPIVTSSRDDGMELSDPYPAGQTTTITWTAEDDCGNTSTATTTVTVSNQNEMIVDLAYDGPLDAVVERCIAFEFTGNDSTIDTEIIEFDLAGAANGVSVLVPCGDYDCVTIRDPLHTLATSVPVSINGTVYEANATGGDAMITGNLNDDIFVDILDFGVFVSQFGDSLPQDTNCATPAPHADITGDGTVGAGDFSSIQLNFLSISDMGCTSMLSYDGSHSLGGADIGHPLEQISVKELHRRGLGHLEVADLNNDNWLDQQDIAAFINGARP